MPARIANITIHAKEPIPLAHFWSAVMGYPAFTGWDDDEMTELRASGMTEAELEDRAEAWDGNPAHQRFYFSRYDHERRARNRMHIDITPFDDRRASRAEIQAEAQRLVGLGASIESEQLGYWGPYEEFVIMMRDPEGNEFCLQ